MPVVTCPRCETRFDAPGEDAGRQARCPRCSYSIRFPATAAAPATPARAPAASGGCVNTLVWAAVLLWTGTNLIALWVAALGAPPPERMAWSLVVVANILGGYILARASVEIGK